MDDFAITNMFSRQMNLQEEITKVVGQCTLRISCLVPDIKSKGHKRPLAETGALI